MAYQTSLKRMEWLAKLMDAQFRLPGTNIRFGLDAIVGLIPGGGDFATFIISALMLSTFAKKGASGYLLARMAMNIVLDAVVGSIPLIGDLFDVAFKANQRNLKLMKEHYYEDRHSGSASKVIIPLLLILLIICGFIAWLSYIFISWLYHFFS